MASSGFSGEFTIGEGSGASVGVEGEKLGCTFREATLNDSEGVIDGEMSSSDREDALARKRALND